MNNQPQNRSTSKTTKKKKVLPRIISFLCTLSSLCNLKIISMFKIILDFPFLFKMYLLIVVWFQDSRGPQPILVTELLAAVRQYSTVTIESYYLYPSSDRKVVRHENL